MSRVGGIPDLGLPRLCAKGVKYGVLFVEQHGGFMLPGAGAAQKKAPRQVRWGARKRGAQILVKILVPHVLHKRG